MCERVVDRRSAGDGRAERRRSGEAAHVKNPLNPPFKGLRRRRRRGGAQAQAERSAKAVPGRREKTGSRQAFLARFSSWQKKGKDRTVKANVRVSFKATRPGQRCQKSEFPA